MIKKILINILVVLTIGFGTYYLFSNKQYVSSKYSNCELGDLVGDDVERITYQKFNIDYHTEDFSKAQIENFAKNCINDGVKNQYQMDCCMRKQMYP